MAYYNVSDPTKQATLQISTASISTTSTGYVVPALQDITVNNASGVYNWQQLDTFGQFSIPTPANNSVSGNLVIDSTSFWTGSNGVPGLFTLNNAATLIYFRVYFDGRGTGAKYVSGSGYITNLAPTTNPGAPIWVSPFTLAVAGDLTSGTV